MGLFTQLTTMLGLTKKEVRVLVLGLDSSGKTTILNQLKPTDARSSQIVPTVGYNVEKFISSNLSFTAFDMSGHGRYRNLWEAYYKETDGIIFVIDSSDRLRMAVARDELWMLLDNKDILSKKVPLLVLANKIDEKGSMNASEVSQTLGLDLIRNRNWHVCGTCALTGQGLADGIGWFAQNIRSYLDSRK
ncbi:hypothetical protein AB6A40_000197 [Gnathostoma spinigerum]|uniref:ADP-ribosylation factor-like protein 6 n=1 Tax=Gnathostoma spinigerum TaxID=75299 RepID=A0ABD6E1Q4_9BILA